jgi:hypothetical protein
MICRWGFVLLIVCMAFSPAPALASEIVLVVKTSVSVTEQAVDVRLEIDNRGNEDALVVTPYLRLAGVKTGLETVPHVAFDGGRIWVHSFPVGELAFPEAGVYPLVVQLRFHDAYMYPYSLVSVTGVQLGKSLPLAVPVAGEMVAEQVTDEGTLDVRVRNTGDLSLEARLTMVSPAELVVLGDSGKLSIPAGGQQQLSYTIKNNGALPGSSHSVYAIIEYSISGQHGVLILEKSVAVASVPSNTKRSMIITGAGFIVLLFFVVLFIEFRAGARTA